MPPPTIIHTWYGNQGHRLCPEDVDLDIYENDKEISAKEYGYEYAEYCALWGKNNHSQKVQNFLQSAVNGPNKPPIKKLLCIGLGKLARSNWIPRDKVSSYANSLGKGTHHRVCHPATHQLVFLEIVVRILHSQGYDFGKVTFQDPKFNEVDKSFLRGRGHIVVEDPTIQNQMTKDTLLFAPDASFPAIAQCLETCYPAIYIGTNPQREVEATGGKSEPARTFVPFLQATHAAKIPDLDGATWESSNTINWPKSP